MEGLMATVENIALEAAKEVFANSEIGKAYGFVFKYLEPEIYRHIEDFVIQAEASKLSRQEVALAVAAYVHNCMRLTFEGC